MSHLYQKMDELLNKCKDLRNEYESEFLTKSKKNLEEAINKINKSWSGSWIGYQADVYYKNFGKPPPNHHFSIEWGLEEKTFNMGTIGPWESYNYDTVINKILEYAGQPDIDKLFNICEELKSKYCNYRDEISTLLEIYLSERENEFIKKVHEVIDNQNIYTKSDFINHYKPSGNIIIRDSRAMSQGLRVPPHIDLKCNLFSHFQPKNLTKTLMKNIRKIKMYLDSKDAKNKNMSPNDGKIFIGHGKSRVWKDLKDFLDERLDLEWDEFNREPVAGISTKERLSQMLDEAKFAFLIFTGEDEHEDDKLHARENVIHEAGLFQGRIGFRKAIILLEEDCTEFSNIHGLNQIRFKNNDISSQFEEIRRVLERENII